MAAPCYICEVTAKSRSKTAFRFDTVKFRRTSIAALLVACAFLVMHAIFGQNGFMALRREKSELRELRKEVQDLQRQNQQLEMENKKLESDPKAIEKLAREQLRMARPGEVIYTLPQQTPSKNPAATKPPNQ